MVTKINISCSAALFTMKNLEGKKNNYKQCASIDSIQYHSWLTVGSQVTWIFCKFFYYISTYTFTFCVRHDIKSSYFFRFLSSYICEFDIQSCCQWSYVGIHWFSLFCFCLFFKGFYDEHGSFIKQIYIYIYI